MMMEKIVIRGALFDLHGSFVTRFTITANIAPSTLLFNDRVFNLDTERSTVMNIYTEQPVFRLNQTETDDDD